MRNFTEIANLDPYTQGKNDALGPKSNYRKTRQSHSYAQGYTAGLVERTKQEKLVTLLLKKRL